MPGRAIYPHEVNMLITGKITIVYDKQTGASVPMIYQRVGRGFGNVKRLGARDLQLRRYLPQRDPRRPMQLAGRRRIAAATRAYQALSMEDRRQYQESSQDLTINGYNLFVQQFCQQHPLENFMEDRVKLEFYGSAGAIARPFTALKFYILER